MIAQFHSGAGAGSVNPISRWEDDGGPAAGTSHPTEQNTCGVNVGGTERAWSAFAGASLVAIGLSRRSLPGLVAAIGGAGLVFRGLTGRCGFYRAIGISTAETSNQSAGAQKLVDQRTGAPASSPVEYRARSTAPGVERESEYAAGQSPPESVADSQTSETSATAPSPYEHSVPAPSAPHVAHPPERHSEGAGGAEPQGRT